MKKALKIICLSLIGVALVVAIIGYIFWKEQTIQVFDLVVDYINRPLPIVGVSSIIVAAFLYKCFVSTKYGKKALNELLNEKDKAFEELEQKKELLNKKEEEIKALVNAHQSEIDYIKNYLVEFCKLSNNVKVKELGEKLESGYELKTQDIIANLDKYKDDFLISKGINQDELISALKEHFDSEIAKLREELEHGKEEIDSDTEKE